MQAIPRWRNLLLLKNSVIQSTAVVSTSSNTQFAEFHSTRTSYQKWEKKWNSGTRAGQQPSKAYMRYKVRQKRADTKKALKDLLFNSGSSRFTFEDSVPESDISWSEDEEAPFQKKDRSKSSHTARRAAKAQHRRMKRQSKKQKSYQDVDSSDNVFRISLRHRGCTWSYWSGRDFFDASSTTGFDWKESTNKSKSYQKQRESDIESETESDDDNCAQGMYSERKLLGLPTRGPLKIEDIKKAFHLSALRWHPDKHQGPSQGMAEEKFKLCVDAYKSLCNALSTA